MTREQAVELIKADVITPMLRDLEEVCAEEEKLIGVDFPARGDLKPGVETPADARMVIEVTRDLLRYIGAFDGRAP